MRKLPGFFVLFDSLAFLWTAFSQALTINWFRWPIRNGRPWPDNNLTRRNIEAQAEAKKLDGFQYKCMKRILRIRWPQTISHQQIQENTEVNSTSDEIRRRRWNWIGHIMRKDREEHCVTALEWRPEGRRRSGRSKATWRWIVEGKRKTAGCQSWASVKILAANRSGWK